MKSSTTIESTINVINAIIKKEFRSVFPQEPLRLALERDLKKSGRLPTEAECRAMIVQGGEDAEDYEHPKALVETFPSTLKKLECAWQMRGMDCGALKKF